MQEFSVDFTQAVWWSFYWYCVSPTCLLFPPVLNLQFALLKLSVCALNFLFFFTARWLRHYRTWF